MNREEIRLAGSVKSVDRELVLIFLSIVICLRLKTQQSENTAELQVKRESELCAVSQMINLCDMLSLSLSVSKNKM